MSQGAWVLVVALLLATGFGLWRAARDGRFRGTHSVRGSGPAPTDSPDITEAARRPGVLAGADIDHELGERVTLLQFSSAFCAPCRATRRVLSDVAGVVPGVVHIEVDARDHLGDVGQHPSGRAAGGGERGGELRQGGAFAELVVDIGSLADAARHRPNPVASS